MINLKKLARILLIFQIGFFLSKCQLKIPLTYYPVYKINFTSPLGIMQYLIDQKVYANLEIGEPKITIQIPLNFEVNDFYIIDEVYFNHEEDIYDDINVYDPSKSNTHDIIEEFNSYQTYYFQSASLYKDNFYFNNKSYELEFYRPFDDSVPESGGIGMNFLFEYSDATPTKEGTFFGKLKKAKLSNGYYWSIFYNSKNIEDNRATLLIGILPHELDSDLGYYKKENFTAENKRTVNLEQKSTYLFKTDYIVAYEGNNKNKLINDFPSGNSDYLNILLDFHSGGIRAPTKLKPFYHRIFEKYLNENLCFNRTIKRKDINFYYCNNDINMISEIKSSFPSIILISNDLKCNFTIEAEDLFVEKDGYVFCLLFFSSSTQKNWEMGKPFLKKYLFTINQPDKYVAFYNSENENDSHDNYDKEEKEGISPTIFILVIIGTIIVVSLFCFLIFKFYLYDKYFRKKKANELEEDGDFDYAQKNDNANDALNINNFTYN